MSSSSTLSAEVAALTEMLARSRDRVVSISEPLTTADHEDVLSSLYEAERLLRAAERALVRAGRAIR